MTDQENLSSLPDDKKKESDREAKLIHDLATTPPGKDVASVKAASDVFEANRKKREPAQRAPVHP